MKYPRLMRYVALLVTGTVLAMLSLPAPAQTATEVQKLVPADDPIDHPFGDQFGGAVAADGDTALIGARFDEDTGSVYVFTRDAVTGLWIEQTKLTASDGTAGDAFGSSVALDGDTALIGAAFDDGSVYVFTRDPTTGLWTEQTKLMDITDVYGIEVALDGDWAVVGVEGPFGGGAAIFGRDGTTGLWNLVAPLFPSGGSSAPYFDFGSSVALDGEVAIVGFPGADGNADASGAAYVFTRDAATGEWSEEARLTASDGTFIAGFGGEVAIAGDTAVIGASNDDNNGIRSGSAYVFTRDSTTGLWMEQAKLTASDGAAESDFGASIATDGATAVIGALSDSENGRESGAAYVFTYDAATGLWTEQTKLIASDGAVADELGTSVALVGDTALAGAPDDAEGGSEGGSVYVFGVESDASSGGDAGISVILDLLLE